MNPEREIPNLNLKLKLKVKTNAHGTKRLEPNQDDALVPSTAGSAAQKQSTVHKARRTETKEAKGLA